VFPSTTETLGLVLLEALASGLPIVAADSPASRELLADCPVARLYPPAEPERIADLVHELRSQDRRWQSRTARATALPWTWEVATRKLVGRYEQARTRTGSGPARPRPLAQLAKFCSVGLTNGVVDLGVFNLLLWLAPTRNPNQLVVYNTVAVVAAIINSYLLNSRWTFRGLRHTGRAAATRQRLLFLAQALLNIGINDLAVWSLARVLHDVVLVSAAGTNNAVKLVAMLTSSMVSFALLRFVVFRRHKH
jgi:putative flippase GtrA